MSESDVDGHTRVSVLGGNIKRIIEKTLWMLTISFVPDMDFKGKNTE